MKDRDNAPLTFVSLALALANDYTRLFVIDAKDDSYIEYSASGDNKELTEVSGGKDFFDAVRRDCLEQVWQEDQEYFLNAFKKDAMLEALKNGQSFSLTYRLNIEGQPRYFFLKTIRGRDENVIIGVQDIHEQKMREELSETYSHIAGALASRYEVIYYIDIDSNAYTQYSSSEQYAKLGTTKQGEDFFKDATKDIAVYIHPSDVMHLLKELDKERLMQNLSRTGSVTLNYRQLLDDRQQYMSMIIVQPKKDRHHIVMGVLNTDTQTRREQSLAAETQTFSDISLALAQRYEVIYHVNIETNEYSEYSASEKYTRLKVGTKGEDFFGDTYRNMQRDIYPDDLPMMCAAMKKENLMKSLSTFGKIYLNYRLMLDGKPQYVSLYAVRPKEDSSHIIVAVANVDASKRMEIAYHNAMDMANRDPLTGVKNKRAYAQLEIELDEQIKDEINPEFAVLVCDINCLKEVNDTLGHKAGDEFIKSACLIICHAFTHSPVFRIGGDEFAVILKGSDFINRKSLMERLLAELENSTHNGIKVLACGISDFEAHSDIRVQDVFERADALMYDDKRICKNSCR